MQLIYLRHDVVPRRRSVTALRPGPLFQRLYRLQLYLLLLRLDGPHLCDAWHVFHLIGGQRGVVQAHRHAVEDLGVELAANLAALRLDGLDDRIQILTALALEDESACGYIGGSALGVQGCCPLRRSCSRGKPS